MKLLPFLIITIIYLIILTLYNYSLYKLLTNENFGHQYYLILIYFLCELFSFFYYFCSKKRGIIIGDINPFIVATELTASLSISDISNNNNYSNFGNSSISNIRSNSDNSSIDIASNNSNDSMDSNITTIPFVGIKCVGFTLSSFFDFLSKLFIYNGIKYMYQDSILRCIIEIIMVSVGSLYILKIKNIYYFLIGLSIIVLYLFIFFISNTVKTNINGIILLLEGGLINSIQYLVHSNFFLKGEQFIYRIVSWEGIFGSIFSLLILVISINISCPFEQNDDDDNTVINNEKDNSFHFSSFCNGKKLESNISTFFADIENNVGWFILYIISCMFYSFFGVLITKYINAVHRISLDSFRMLFLITALLFFNK